MKFIQNWKAGNGKKKGKCRPIVAFPFFFQYSTNRWTPFHIHFSSVSPPRRLSFPFINGRDASTGHHRICNAFRRFNVLSYKYRLHRRVFVRQPIQFWYDYRLRRKHTHLGESTPIEYLIAALTDLTIAFSMVLTIYVHNICEPISKLKFFPCPPTVSPISDHPLRAGCFKPAHLNRLFLIPLQSHQKQKTANCSHLLW